MKHSPERLRSDINVTPLVDVCLVMLIIFMVVTPMIVERVELARTEKHDERKAKRSEQVRLVVGSVLKAAPRSADP